MELQALPEGCIAKILSFNTTPVDLCRLSLVSKSFFSAAESDTVWERFIPSDLTSLISSSSLSSSKKSLFLTLSDKPIIINQGQMSFQLDRRSGKKCYISARALRIIWGDTPQYWNWTTLSKSRFEEVARLLAVCWFDISGTINTLVLSPNTYYAVFLVFKLIEARGFEYDPAVLSVGIIGGNSTTKNVCLDPDLEESKLEEKFEGLQRPIVRSDGWLEIEMGEFFNSGLEDEVEMKVTETTSDWWKQGFYLEGIEVRPKYV